MSDKQMKSEAVKNQSELEQIEPDTHQNVEDNTRVENLEATQQEDAELTQQEEPDATQQEDAEPTQQEELETTQQEDVEPAQQEESQTTQQEDTEPAEEEESDATQQEDVEPAQQEESDATQQEDVEPTQQEEKIDDRQWYIIQCYSGQEHKVKSRIEELISKNKLEKQVFRILVPEEEIVEIKNNKRMEKVIKIYPGYVFIQMLYLDQLFFEIRKLAGVAKFITAKNKAVPIKEDEVLRVLRKVGDKTKTIDVDFEIDEVVKVISGPFRGYTGPICEIFPDKGMLKTLISIFGRETPVKLNFDQVEKVAH